MAAATASAPVASRKFGLLGWLRVVVRIAGMLALLLACVPLYYLWQLARRANPVPRLFLAGIARLSGVALRTEGERNSGSEFLLANHVSWIDVPALAAASGAAFVAHDGLAEVPLLRQLCAMNRTVFVARHDRASVHQQINLIRAALAEATSLAIFPEGTTSNGCDLLPFKSSLLSALDPLPAGVAVQPVVLDYGPDAPAIAWIGVEPGLDNFLRILARSHPVALRVRFLPPLTGPALASRKTIAAAARDAIVTALAQRSA